MRAAIIENNTITNIVEAVSLADVEAIFPSAEVVDAEMLPPGVGIGFTLQGDTWIPPTPEVPSVKIDTPLFIMRFTPQERVAMRQAAKAENEYAPLIEDWLAILNDPRLAYVELGDPNLIAAMGMMVSLGLLTQERADIVMAP